MDVNMPGSKASWEAGGSTTKQTMFKRAMANVSGISENEADSAVRILLISAAGWGVTGVTITTKILADSAADAQALSTTLGTGIALLNKINSALVAKGLGASTGVTDGVRPH